MGDPATSAGPWSGLGARGFAPRPRDDIDFEEPPVQRTVSATAAPSPFHNPLRPDAGSASSSANDDAAEATNEENSMARTPKRGKRATSGASPQFQICAALLAHGDMAGEALQKKVKVKNTQAFHNGIYAAKTNGRIDKLEDGTFTLTDAGKEWVNGGANLKEQQAHDTPARVRSGRRTAKSKDLTKGERRRAGVVSVRNGKPVEEEAEADDHTFRCAVMNDGSFFLAKGETSIELDAAEHAQMLRYLERMAEQPA